MSDVGETSKTAPSSTLKYFILGDSNVRRNVGGLNRRLCPALATATIISCGDLSTFDECVGRVDAECDVLVVACLTNFLVSAGENSTAGKRVEPILDQVR